MIEVFNAVPRVPGVPIIIDRAGILPVFLYMSGGQVDDDGVAQPPGVNDPCYQAQTTYRPFLNANLDRYTVLCPQMFLGVKEQVVGCYMEALNTTTGLWSDGVVGDSGPHLKLGENSVALDRALGVQDSPISGGIDDHVIFYRIYPGRPAILHDGMQYVLQPYKP